VRSSLSTTTWAIGSSVVPDDNGLAVADWAGGAKAVSAGLAAAQPAISRPAKGKMTRPGRCLVTSLVARGRTLMERTSTAKGSRSLRGPTCLASEA
jgi:hypothetical protein